MTRYVAPALTVIRCCAFCAGLMLLTSDSIVGTSLAVGLIWGTAVGASGDSRRDSLTHQQQETS